MLDVSAINPMTMEEQFGVHHGSELENNGYLFRYHDSVLGNCVECIQIEILRETPATYVVKDWSRGSKERRVFKGDGRRYAYPTRKAAWQSFIARKNGQKFHMERHLALLNRILTEGVDLHAPI